MRLTQLAQPECMEKDQTAADEGLRRGRWPNFVNDARARKAYFPRHWGPLSIKCAFRGVETYEADRVRYNVDSSSYLILNTGQLYSSSIDSPTEIESFVVFLRPQFAEGVLTSLIMPEDRLLDEPGRIVANPITFYEGLHPHDDLVSPVLQRLRLLPRQESVTPGWYEEQFHLLLERMLQAHRGVCREMERLECKRRATRVEIYRRLREARDFMDANYRNPLSLTDIAGEACLTQHHFLRLFKQAFDVTPHQYLTDRRLAQAQRLLRVTEMPVTQVCSEIGFESIGSFSNLFRRRFGVPPSHYRKHGANL
jgi:AraC family transcriptional regulator